MAFRWRADDGQTLNAGLIAVIFQGIRTCIAKNPYILVIFQGGGSGPLPPHSGSENEMIDKKIIASSIFKILFIWSFDGTAATSVLCHLFLLHENTKMHRSVCAPAESDYRRFHSFPMKCTPQHNYSQVFNIVRSKSLYEAG